MFRVINETNLATETLATEYQWKDWTDEELFLEYRSAGTHEAFEELVLRYKRELYNYLYRYLSNADNAEDVLQKTILVVMRKCDKFEAGREFRPWLYKIATNNAIDHIRQAKRFAVISIDIPLDGNLNACSIANNVAGNEPEPFEDVADREIVGKVREAVDSLPKTMRQAVYMVYFQGLSHREAADAIGIHCTTMSQRVRHAVKKLNFMLKSVG